MHGVVPWDTIKPAEVLVVEIRVLPTIIARRELRIEDGILQGVKALHLVGPILVAPHAVVILSVIMVVLAWIHNERNLRLPRGTATIEIRALNVWNIGFHQLLHSGTCTSLR